MANSTPRHTQRTIVTCPAGLGGGGLGQHLSQIVHDERASGFEPRALCHGGVGVGDFIDPRWESKWFKWPPLRFRPDLRVWLRHVVFDRQAAAKLGPCEQVTAFMGAALTTFGRARSLGVGKLVLEMPNSHPANVQKQHGLAYDRHPLERSWMSDAFRLRVEREMKLADEVRANSDYTAQSAIAMGVPPEKIVRRHLPPDPRFGRIERVAALDGRRTAILVGSLSVVKGIPFIVDIFRQLEGDDIELLLFGGWSSRGIRKFLEASMAADSRIRCASGDPAPWLAKASIALHPSWEDGWGYAPAEAAAAGLPVLVSDQTGVKETLPPDAILPTGDTQAWYDRLSVWANGGRP